MKRLVVGAIIVDSLANPTRLVSARRRGPAELAGYWEFPGGKLEPGETPEQALHRELREELNITVTLGDAFTKDGNPWPITPKYDLQLFFAELVSGEFGPGPDHDAIRWLAAGELNAVPWLPSDAEAVAALTRALTICE